MNKQQQQQAERMSVLDQLFDPAIKIIATPHPDNSALARYVEGVEGILREGYKEIKRTVLFLQNGLAAPGDHFEAATKAFSKKAKRFKIKGGPENAKITSLMLLPHRLKRLSSENEYQHKDFAVINGVRHYIR